MESEHITLFDYQPYNLKEAIKNLLIEYPAYRDSDEKLAAHIWRKEVSSFYKTAKVNIDTFLDDFSQNAFISYETIRRYRQWVQHQNPHLKGNKKRKRADADQEVRKRVNQNRL